MNQDPTPRTDWDSYYANPFPATRFTRSVIRRKLLQIIQTHRPPSSPFSVLEFGAGNSIFAEALLSERELGHYLAVDTCESALDSLRKRFPDDPRLSIRTADVRTPYPETADVVFSVGLIEHFSPEDTARAIETHLSAATPGGLVLLFFPTPRFPYPATRKLAEWLGLWRFPDERPLPESEVRAGTSAAATILERGLLRRIFLTQGFLALRKNPV